MSKSALIIGGSVAGLQAALDLADNGITVHLAEPSPFLVTADNSGLAPHLLNARLLEVIRHPNITVWTKTHLDHLEVESGTFRVRMSTHPRHIDLTQCTACEACIEVCPVTIPGTDHKAIYLDGQPGCMAIEKVGKSPCANTCPAGIHVQGYVALIAQSRFQEAIDLIHEAMPFPSVCGRVCNHQCESNCTRGKVGEPVNIMTLKRFVAEWEYNHRHEQLSPASRRHPEPTGKKIAIIGAGPAGLTAARDLIRMGHAITIFDSLPLAGGMMRVGIPPHRLPSELLDWEIQQIIAEGVELKLNTWVDDIPGLLENGFDAVLIATGAHAAKKLSIRNSNHRDNWMSLDVLRRTCLGEKIDLSGKRVVVLGGGNVALDTARTVLRLGASEVRMACLEPRGEMPGFDWEIGVAEEEGIEICPARTFKEIMVEDDKVKGVKCTEVVFRGFTRGRPDIEEIPETEHVIPGDLVIWAIGQMPNFSFLPQDGSVNTNYPVGIQSDTTMSTTMPGVFVAGDVRRGVTFFVVDAIGEGHMVARSIDRYLRGEQGIPEPVRLPAVSYTDKEIKVRLKLSKTSRQERVKIASIPLGERTHNFNEVDITITETQAVAEAQRCLICGPCSECLACVQACEAGAIVHEQQKFFSDLDFSAILYAGDPSDFTFTATDGLFRIPPDDALAASAVSFQALACLASEYRPLTLAAAPLLTDGPARIGVFLCQCGDEIAQAIDLEAVRKQVADLPNVIHTQLLSFSCSPDAADVMQATVNAYQLDRAVLAACSCCSLNQVCFSCTYQRVRCKENLGLFTTLDAGSAKLQRPAQTIRFEFVNLREQCARVHTGDLRAATAKAATLVAATIARVRAAPIRLAGPRQIEKSVLILGSGVAGATCQPALSQLGISASLVDRLPSQVQRAGGQYVVNVDDQIWQASALVLVPKTKRQANQLLVAFGRERRRPEARTDWGGLETRRPGIYYCDPSQDSAMAGAAVAARVAAWLGRAQSRPPIAAIVDPERCRACKTCIETCEYCAPELAEINGRYAAWIDPAICRGCGTCAVHCPSGAITAGCSTDAQLQAMLGAILK
jgi:NADPH-dependent glutamate synthase beta subunit-like oxidoreductase